MTILKGVQNISDIYKAYQSYLEQNQPEKPVDPNAPVEPSPKIQEVMAELKKKSPFNTWTDRQLLEYALTCVAQGDYSVIGANADAALTTSSRPKNPQWDNYSYEEILQMENNGVSIPKNIIDWARSMQDSDVTTYEVTDDSSVDGSSQEAGDDKQHELEQKAQKLTKKSREHKDGLFSNFEKLATLEEKSKDIKKEAEDAQKNAVKEVNELLEEWKELDKKLQKGTKLTETEQKRYRELGIQLNGVDGELTKTIMEDADDLSKLTETMKTLTKDAPTGIDLGTETVSTAVELADYEGGYNSKRTTLAMSFQGVSGEVADQLFGSQGASVSRDALDIGTDLRNYSFQVDDQIRSNECATLCEFAGSYKTVLDETVETTKKEMGGNFNESAEDFKTMELGSEEELNGAQQLRKNLQEQGVSLKDQGLIFTEKSNTAAKENMMLNMQLAEVQRQDKNAKDEAQKITNLAVKIIKPKVEKYNKLAKEVEDDYENIDVQTNNDKKVNGPATSSTPIIKEEDNKDNKPAPSENPNAPENPGNTKTKAPETQAEAENLARDDKAKANTNEDKNNENTDNGLSNTPVKTADEVESNDPKVQELNKNHTEIVTLHNKAQEKIGINAEKVSLNQKTIFDAQTPIQTNNEIGIETVNIGGELISGLIKDPGAQNAVNTGAGLGTYFEENGAVPTARNIAVLNPFMLTQNILIGLGAIANGGKAMKFSDIAEETRLASLDINNEAANSIVGNIMLVEKESTVDSTPKEVAQKVAEKQAADKENATTRALAGTSTDVTDIVETVDTNPDSSENNNGNNNNKENDDVKTSDSDREAAEKTVEAQEKVTDKRKKDSKKVEKDTKDVQKDGKEAKQVGQKAKQETKELENDDKKIKEDIKQTEAELKEAEQKIQELIADSEEVQALMEALAAEDEGNQGTTNSFSTSMAAGGAQGGVTGGAAPAAVPSRPASRGQGGDKQMQMQAYVTRLMGNSKQVASLSATSTRKSQRITQLMTKQQIRAAKVQKSSEDTTKKHEKLKKAIGIVDKVMSLTKITGTVVMAVGGAQVTSGVVLQTTGAAEIVTGSPMVTSGNVMITTGTAMLSNPFTAAAGAALISAGTPILSTGTTLVTSGTASIASGTTLEGTGEATIGTGNIIKMVGFYGGAACKLTNIAIDVADGNLMGALMGGVALGMSCLDGIPAVGDATAAVDAAKETAMSAIDGAVAGAAVDVATSDVLGGVANGTITDITQSTLTGTMMNEATLAAFKAGANTAVKSTFGTVVKSLASTAVLQELGSMAISSFSANNKPGAEDKKHGAVAYDAQTMKKLRKQQRSRTHASNSSNRNKKQR